MGLVFTFALCKRPAEAMVKSLSATIACLFLNAGDAFVGVATNHRSLAVETELSFGIPGFLTPKSDEDQEDEASKKDENVPKKEVGWKGLVQLVTAGAGAPFLGDFQGVDEETGKFMFSLEANNLVDENGNSKQTSMPYFESGWVDPADAEREAKRKEEGFKFPWQK